MFFKVHNLTGKFLQIGIGNKTCKLPNSRQCILFLPFNRFLHDILLTAMLYKYSNGYLVLSLARAPLQTNISIKLTSV